MHNDHFYAVNAVINIEMEGPKIIAKYCFIKIWKKDLCLYNALTLLRGNTTVNGPLRG